MERKIIIKNNSSLSDEDALYFVLKVVKGGKVSNNNTQYCYISLVKTKTTEIQIYCDETKSGTCFVFTEKPLT